MVLPGVPHGQNYRHYQGTEIQVEALKECGWAGDQPHVIQSVCVCVCVYASFFFFLIQ